MSNDCSNDEFTLDNAETPWLVGYKESLEQEHMEYVWCLALSETDACRQVEDLYPMDFVIEATNLLTTFNLNRSQQQAA